MNAVISGSAGVALILEGNKIYSVHADDLDVERGRQPWEVKLLLGEAKDLQYCSDIRRSEVKERLREAVLTDSAFHLALYCLDDDTSEGLRREIAVDLAERLQSDRILERLECIFYARPLPDDADIDGALLHCESAPSDTMRAYAFFLRLCLFQSEIQEVHDAWGRIPTRCFGDRRTVDRVQVEGEAARAGLFRGLVLCLVENKRVDEWIAETLARPEVKCISNIEEVLQVWAAPLKQILEDSNRIPENSEWSGRVRIPGMVYDAMIEEFEHRSKAAKKAG